MGKEITKEFSFYNGDLSAKLTLDAQKNMKIIQRIVKYCVDNECTSSEKLAQSDECLEDVVNLGCDLMDILDFKTEWNN